MLQLEAPIKVVGDVHGQYFDLLRILEAEGKRVGAVVSFCWVILGVRVSAHVRIEQGAPGAGLGAWVGLLV